MKRGTGLSHTRVVERSLLIERRVAGGEQQRIAFAQRNVQHLRQDQQHLAARHGLAGFEKAHMARGDAGVERKIELGQMAQLAPATQQGAAAALILVHD